MIGKEVWTIARHEERTVVLASLDEAGESIMPVQESYVVNPNQISGTTKEICGGMCYVEGYVRSHEQSS